MTQFLRYSEFIEAINESNNNILFEGGAYGHLSHPFDDMNLSLGDLHQMIKDTINGAFGPENFVQEKTDGQNLMISWKNGKLIAARNGSHIKNAGKNALDISSIAEMFAGRGDIEIAYNSAMKDLTNSIGGLSDEDKKKYFQEGKSFLSLEVITPITQNTVPYGQNMIVFHGVVEYDENGKSIGEDKQAGRDLGKLIKDANLAAQETFYVRGPQDMSIKPLPNSAKRASYYEKAYSNILKETGLNDNNTVYDYALSMGRLILKEEAIKSNIAIPSDALDGLSMRIAGINKSFSVSNIKKSLGEDASWYINLEEKSSKILKRKVYAPLESLFLEIGTEFMKNMSVFLSANPTQASEDMRKEVDSAISKIKTTGSEEEVEKLEHELSRISAAGGLDGLVPTEGITFIYKGKLYKYTGIFMAIHQIRSMLVYKKK
tara:strand:- start:2265 stop:3560 length:1296 start_codon:yes stop_codon:yes gene_type:complete